MVLANCITAYGVELHRLQEKHLEMVRLWRNHPEVSRHMLTTGHISAEQQQQWYERYRDAADRAYYVVFLKGEPTGFASVTAEGGQSLEQAETVEAAIYFSPESPCRGNMSAFAPALALNDACFSLKQCECLLARVKEGNDAAYRFNTAMGYQVLRRNKGIIYMTLSRSAYAEHTTRIKALLSRRKGESA